MDDIVKQAIAKWPNVPAVYGWLSLNRRGNWLIKDEPISNRAIADFIGRNYEHDVEGRWYFQNGPQRVYVALDYTPLVYRLAGDVGAEAPPRIEAHTGKPAARVDSAWIDDAGVVLLATEHGIGIIDDRDLERLLPWLSDERGAAMADDVITATLERLQTGGDASLYFRYRENAVPLKPIKARRVALKFGFVARPAQSPGEDECI